MLVLIRGDASAERTVPPSGATGYLSTIAAGAMTLLAIVALCLALTATRAAERWDGALTGVATLTLPPASGESAEAQAARAVLVLGQIPGISRVDLLTAAETRALIEPWLGDTNGLLNEDLPQMLALTEGAALDHAALAARLDGELPGAQYHRHEAWGARFAAAARSVRTAAYGTAVLALAVVAIVVTLASTAALARHRDVIETLRLIGARDAYIARAFTRRFTLRAGTGALAGTALALVFLRALGPSGAASPIGSLLPQSVAGWVLILSIIPAVALIAFLSTRRAALRTLYRLS